MLRLGRAAAARMSAALAAMEMHPHEYAVLHALSEEGGISQAELAATLRVHPSNLVALLDGLESGGLVERRRDPRDRRRQLLELGPEGAARLTQARAAVDEADQSLLDPLPGADRQRLRRYLEQLAAHSCAPPGARGRRC
jgi:DNA-binding MarR family transcriptional regulator